MNIDGAFQSYLTGVPEDRKEAVQKIREVILGNIPEGFEEGIASNGISYFVPLHRFPPGYHTKANIPLALIWLTNEKGFISLHHMGLYGNKNLLDWFSAEYAKHVATKLDKGKACVRFKKMDQIPYALIAELVKKISVERWIEIYTAAFSKRTRG